jgi:hypothetical protein
MSKFKIGEVVIVNCPDFQEYNGTEMTILEVFKYNGDTAYMTDFEPDVGLEYKGWYESSIRKKYDGDEKTTWDSMKDIWTPDTVGA